MKVVFATVTLVVVGLAVFEMIMRPSAAERVEVGIIFAFMALLTALAAVYLPRFARRARTLRITVVGLSVTSFLIVVFGLVASAQRMFLSDHDLAILLVFAGFGVSAALMFAILTSGPLTSDLTRMAATAGRITSGDLGSRAEIDRLDEVGELSSAIDEMAVTLQRAEIDRMRDDDARREFFAAVGHDLRTPLASLQLAVEAMQDGVASEPVRYLDSMGRDIEALSRLVDDLFLLARLESGSLDVTPALIDLTEMADEAIEVLEPIARRADVSLRLDAERRVMAEAGPEAVMRVMRNLLDNAIRHSPAGGEVVVTVTNGSSAAVSVRDEGPGFNAEFVDRAFERFSRDDAARLRATGGAGLGLAIAEGFVTALGGEIWAEPGPGGKVAFLLPNHPS